MLNIGDMAPDFTVKTHEGKEVHLSDYKGKKVVLWFYPKSDTPGWTLQGCGFRDRIQKFDDKNTVVLGVSFDSEKDNLDFAKKFDFPFPLLCDTKHEIGFMYGACKAKTDKFASRIAYVVDPEGKIKQFYCMLKGVGEPSGGFMTVTVTPKGSSAQAKFTFYNEQGKQMYSHTKWETPNMSL